MKVVVTISFSPNLVNHVSPNLLDIFHAIPPCSLASPFLECHNLSPINSNVVLKRNVVDYVVSLGTFRRHDPSLNPCTLYLENMP